MINRLVMASVCWFMLQAPMSIAQTGPETNLRAVTVYVPIIQGLSPNKYVDVIRVISKDRKAQQSGARFSVNEDSLSAEVVLSKVRVIPAHVSPDIGSPSLKPDKIFVTLLVTVEQARILQTVRSKYPEDLRVRLSDSVN